MTTFEHGDCVAFEFLDDEPLGTVETDSDMARSFRKDDAVIVRRPDGSWTVENPDELVLYGRCDHATCSSPARPGTPFCEYHHDHEN